MFTMLQSMLLNRFESGILLLRLFSGYLMIVNHGYGKITAGPALWEKLGGAMEPFGIYFFSPFIWLNKLTLPNTKFIFFCIIFIINIIF